VVAVLVSPPLPSTPLASPAPSCPVRHCRHVCRPSALTTHVTPHNSTQTTDGDDVILSKEAMQQQQHHTRQHRRPMEPFEVPRFGAYYAHDDRGEEPPPTTRCACVCGHTGRC
jgi:DNA-directed RNA polymerase subunit M/transcription elongation factor TFIIS